MELRDGGIVTVDDLTTLSEESLIAHHGIRWEDVCAIKAVLFEKGLALTVEQPLYPMVDPDLMAVAEQKHVPLDRLPLKRLAIPENWEARLTEAGLTAIGPLAEASWVVLQARCFGRYPKAIDTMRLQLKRYIAWVVQQDAWDEQVLDQGITAALGTELSRTSLNDVVSELLRSLPEKREGEIIALRFGLYDGEPKTLEEIGQLYGISRERVRQIQRQAMHRLRHPSRKSMKALLTDFLEAILIQSGGLARTGYLADVLKDNIPHAGLSVRKAVRFFCTMDSRFVELSSEGAWDTWGVADYPVEYVQSINRSMADILAEKGVPTSETELLLEFKESPLYLAIQKDVTDQFVYACLHANPRIQVSKDGYCALRRQIRRQTSYPRKPKRQIDEIDELIWRWREEGLTLAEIGRRLGGISRQAVLSRIIRTGWHFEDHGGTGGHTP